MVQPSGYDITSYGEMIDCEPRMGIYADALKRAITPGCTVIDIGAGFGAFSLLACKYGAGSVIAIEPDSSVELIMPMAKANGCADKITVVRDISTRFNPEDKADVIISDVRGTMPLYEGHIETIVDARERLLKPGGHQLPMRDTICIALVRSPKMYRACAKPWVSNDYGIDLSLGRQYAVNDYMRANLDARALLSEAQPLATLDYRTITDPNLDRTTELTAAKPAIAHGMLMWFDAEIAPGLSYSNGPGEPPLVYGQMFLPFAEPVRLKEGDRVSARIRARLAGASYIWSWTCKVFDRDSDTPRLRFNQSTFKGHVYAKDKLDQFSNAFVPQTSSKLAIDNDCLSLIDGERSLAEITEILLERHPAAFASDQDALSQVANLLRRYDTSRQ